MSNSVSKLSLVPVPVSTSLERLVEDYLIDCRAAGLSPATVKQGYGFPLRQIFLPWAQANGIESVEQLSSRLLNQYAIHLEEAGGKTGKPLTVSTRWTYMKAVKRFLAWAKAEGEKVSASAKLPKLPKREVPTLSAAEVDKMEAGAGNIRDAIIVRLLADTGLRREELTKLTVNDLVDEGRKTYLRVHGKGSRDRRVPVTPRLVRRLRRYVAGRPCDVDSSRIFLGLKRRPDGELAPLTPSGVTQMIRNLGERVLEKRVWPHELRHTAATSLRRRGMDSLDVARILGHSSLRMMEQFYDHVSGADVHDAMMAALRAED
jgi:integrase/recombinase XerD